jgi:molybdenum cofactor cytidylyltransferase
VARPSIAAIILAAGGSTRMGTPKALLDYQGETFVARLQRLFAKHSAEVIVVGHPGATYATVVNPAPERGMLSSLQCGLGAISSGCDAAVFTLVDLPAVLDSTIESILGGWNGEILRIPSYLGRRGHPVLVAAPLIPEFLHATGTPKDVIARHASEIIYVDVDDPGVTMDIDTPEDYVRLKQA